MLAVKTSFLACAGAFCPGVDAVNALDIHRKIAGVISNTGSGILAHSVSAPEQVEGPANALQISVEIMIVIDPELTGGAGIDVQLFAPDLYAGLHSEDYQFHSSRPRNPNQRETKGTLILESEEN